MKMEKYRKLTDFEFNKENPFLKQSLEVVNQNLARKYKTATKTGEKAILQAFDPNSGELLGHTQFIRQIEVDEDKFAKLYLTRFPQFFDLKPQAIRVFGYILNQLIPNRDEFIFDREECMIYTGYKSDKSVFIGLTELLKSEIIARGSKDYKYFINPMVVFNGNRISFVDTYVKKKKKPEPENPDQLKLDFLNN